MVGSRSVESGQAVYLALVSALPGLSYPLRDAPVRPDGDEDEHRPERPARDYRPRLEGAVGEQLGAHEPRTASAAMTAMSRAPGEMLTCHVFPRLAVDHLGEGSGERFDRLGAQLATPPVDLDRDRRRRQASDLRRRSRRPPD